ncbi:piggyBac transposable element-derived protein 4 isoform X2 [Amia ocellicauda]|uniref:piggyBac transposable element-derived protein 4 isoform X2 n=1 Tax=Amia ocellicauda TaxID=2972642 RepID=UPI003463B62D
MRAMIIRLQPKNRILFCKLEDEVKEELDTPKQKRRRICIPPPNSTSPPISISTSTETIPFVKVKSSPPSSPTSQLPAKRVKRPAGRKRPLKPKCTSAVSASPSTSSSSPTSSSPPLHSSFLTSPLPESQILHPEKEWPPPTPTIDLSAETWNMETTKDEAPIQPQFIPARTPGIQLSISKTYSRVDLFKLFFSNKVVDTLCTNTTKQGIKQKKRGRKFKWKPVEPGEFYIFLAVVIAMGIARLPSVTDYWTNDESFRIPFCNSFMSRSRFRTIMWNLQMSDPDEDEKNDRQRHTPQYDPLFRIRPLFNRMQMACKAYYQPRQNVSIDQRVVVSRSTISQYKKDMLSKWGYKLYVLADSSNGYTCHFNIHTAKSASTEKGPSYDAVMGLMQPSYLGQGYRLYCDNFYTSSELFQDLYCNRFVACGSMRENQKCFPQTKQNAMTKQSERGSIRWIRRGSLLFVKWMDCRELSFCSTIHNAFSGEMTRKRVKSKDGKCETKKVNIPTAVKQHNQFVGGVDLSNQLIQYYTVLHKTRLWYKSFFFHFIDIAVVNAYLLYKEISELSGIAPESQRFFRQNLCFELCGERFPVARPSVGITKHLPEPLVDTSTVDKSKKASFGRLKCGRCKSSKTPWHCKACDVPLCLIVDRNCFFEWHK